MENNINTSTNNIVFYDGNCGLCNYFINLLLYEDKNNVLKFSPLQGQKSAEVLPKDLTQNLSTMVFLENNQIYTESTAILRIFKSIGGVWKLFYVLIIFPKFIRDEVYTFISKNRIKWFGISDNCRFPAAEEKLKFID